MRPALDDLDQLVAPLTDAEHRVAIALSQLGGGWTVYVQPRIGLDQPDFIAMHDHFGVCAIEVKGWEPDAVRRNEYCEFELLDGDDWHRTAEQPRFDASRYRSTIFDQFYALPEDGGSPPPEIRSMLVLPHFSTADAVELMGDCVIHDDEALVDVVGGEVLADMTDAVTGAEHDPPRQASMRRLREHIVPSERVVVPEDQAAPLSAGVIDMAINAAGSSIRRVRGAAGSGKTFGLTTRAAQLASQSKRVLVLSFNITLANRLQAMATERCREAGANPTLVTACNFHTLCTRIVQDAEVAGYVMTAPAGAPWTVAIVAKVQQAFEQGFIRTYDAILVDEGQDFRSSWWQLLRDNLLAADGEMLVVCDPTQDLYDRSSWTLRQSVAAPDIEPTDDSEDLVEGAGESEPGAEGESADRGDSVDDDGRIEPPESVGDVEDHPAVEPVDEVGELADHNAADDADVAATVDDAGPTDAVDDTEGVHDEGQTITGSHAVAAAADFPEDWIDLHGGYRVPSDLSGFANDLAVRASASHRLIVEPAPDHALITGDRAMTSTRSWTNVEHVNDLGRSVGREVVRLLQQHPSLSPGDVTFLCEYHHDGVAAVRVIERAGYPVHHIFSRDPDAPRRRRKHRFWPGSDAVKGCTIHSFKGWETPALVVGIGTEKRAERAAFVALTRTAAPADGREAIVSVVNAKRVLRSLQDEFASEPSPDTVVDEAPAPVEAAPMAAVVPGARAVDPGGYIAPVAKGSATGVEPVPTEPQAPVAAPPAGVGGAFAPPPPPSGPAVDLPPPPGFGAPVPVPVGGSADESNDAHDQLDA